jgi:dynein light chain LC8-type
MAEPESAGNSSVGTDPFKPDGAKAVIKNVDMVEEMQQQSIDIALAAVEKFTIEKDMASFVKREFDRKYGPTWHVVVGKNFGSYVTHGKLSPYFTARRVVGVFRTQS